MWTWGCDGNHELGLGENDITNRNSPVQVEIGKKMIYVKGFSFSSMAITGENFFLFYFFKEKLTLFFSFNFTEDHQVYVWGWIGDNTYKHTQSFDEDLRRAIFG